MGVNVLQSRHGVQGCHHWNLSPRKLGCKFIYYAVLRIRAHGISSSLNKISEKTEAITEISSQRNFVPSAEFFCKFYSCFQKVILRIWPRMSQIPQNAQHMHEISI